ncbi:MAG: SDR family oxidoreductase [Bacteroidota bacterium]
MLLVTGATGFLGATLVRHLTAAGEPVRILRRSTSRLDLLADAAHTVEHAVGDVTDRASVEAALEGVEAVYHAAAYVGFGGAKDAEQLHRVNVRGTAHVADAARAAGVRRLVHVSSIAALGRSEANAGPNGKPIDETATWMPSKLNTAYAESKYLAELEVQRAIAEGLDAVLVNPAVIFGPGRPGENTMQIVEQVRNRKLPAVPSGGTCVVDVEDVADGMRRAMADGASGERYILGGDNLSWRALIDTLAAALGVAPPKRTLPPRLALAAATLMEAGAAVTRRPSSITRESVRMASRTFRYSNAKARADLGCTFRPFADTAARIASVVIGPGS